jgi:hypothetical protein
MWFHMIRREACGLRRERREQIETGCLPMEKWIAVQDVNPCLSAF